MSLAVPPVALYLKSSFALLKQADKTGWSWLCLSEQAREDPAMLRGLRGWEGLLRWQSERHLRIRMDTDASSTGWGAILY